MRWHNGQNRRSRNPNPVVVFQDCVAKWEESAAHSILARSTLTPHKAVYICANQPCPSHFSLASRRRTIHTGYAVIQELTATGYQPRSLPSVLVQEPWVKILRLVGSMQAYFFNPAACGLRPQL